MEGAIFDIQRFCLHDGSGIRTVVFLQGCPLRCTWCANPESQPRVCPDWDGAKPYARRPYTADEVADIALRDVDFYAESGGGVTLSGGEPLWQPDFACALLARLRGAGIHTALETTGLTSEQIYRRVTSHCDLILFDIKHHDPRRHREGTGVALEPILHNLRLGVADGQNILPRIPVIPGYNDSLEDAAGLAALLTGHGLGRAELLPYHSFGESKYKRLGRAYAFEGVPTTPPEALADYAAVLAGHGLATALS